MKVNVLGVKEGVGKSSVALSLSKVFASRGVTLLVDKTPSCGLWRRLGRREDFWCEGKLCVLKLFRTPFRIDEHELEGALRRLERAYGLGWDFIVIDNFSCATGENDLFRIDARGLPVFVSDVPNVKSTLEYSANFSDKYAFVINMAPEGYTIPTEVREEFLFTLSIPLVETGELQSFVKSVAEDVFQRSTKFS